MTIDDLFRSRLAVSVPDAISSPAAAELRARLEQWGYERYPLLDRGSYEHVPVVHEPALSDALAGIASELTARALHVVAARALRLQPGDYLLAHHDALHADHPVELTLDVSPAVVPGAEVHYRRRGGVYFRVPSAPGSLAVVERGPTVACNHTYVSKLHGTASVVRLVLLLRDR
ncbi:MAG: hypothetical protein H0X17_20345 [Deltaproteobacteria bacterium]|nr:hypothetical protein [Deltaproteobacteria bacterium]